MQRVISTLRTVSRLSVSTKTFQKARITPINPDLRVAKYCSVTKERMEYCTVERGCLNTQDYRVFIQTKDGLTVSPFHDIPLYANSETKVCNMVVEIPRWTNHKMEIHKEEKMNPIKQDVKKGNVRFVKNCFPHHGYIWNYGALPQTWEDVDHKEEATGGTLGDNDPLDVCEIGQKVHSRGSIIQVKILGIMCLVDEGETDWKVICIDVTDPLANEINNIDDVNDRMPGIMEATREWFKIYKIPDGKPVNTFAFDGEAQSKERALEVIDETHNQWKRLVGLVDDKEKQVTRGGIELSNTTLEDSKNKITAADAKDIVLQSAAVAAPKTLPEDVDKVYFIRPSQL